MQFRQHRAGALHPATSPGNRRHARACFLSWVALGIVVLVAAATPPCAAAMTDRDIETAVHTRLRRDDAVQAQTIDVAADDGVVALAGRVAFLDAAQRAVRLAASVKGVRAVVDRITVVPAQRPDKDIRIDVQQALRLDPVADANVVDVAVRDAQVMLSGEVDSWQERRLTAAAVQGVPGVRKVVNQLTVKLLPGRPDNDIAEEIAGRMAWDARVDASRVEVAVADGVVTLSGLAGSLAEKKRARQDAWIAGVREVNDAGLVVDWEKQRKGAPLRPRRQISDPAVTRAVQDALHYDPRVGDAAAAIDVRVERGIVTLTGTVERLSVSRAARTDAENTAGVWRVRNLISVRPSIEPNFRPLPEPDLRRAEQVRLALLLAPNLRQHKISVTVNNGVALLEGRVVSAAARERAADAAAGVRGIVQVVNELQVASYDDHPPREDWQLRQDIESELGWSPFVDAAGVSVAVEDGVAVLTGVVDDLRARRMATANARQGGAQRVRNHLKVRHGPDFLQP